MLDETICHQVFDFTTPKTILKSKLFAFEYQIDGIDNWMFPSIKQFGLQVKLLGMLPSILWSSSNQQIVRSNSLHRFVLIFWSQIQTCQSKSRLFNGSIKLLDASPISLYWNPKCLDLGATSPESISMMFGSKKFRYTFFWPFKVRCQWASG